MTVPDTGALKRAAIDAYVHDLADPNLFYRDRTESQYRLMCQGYSVHFSRPDASGGGGGFMANEVIAHVSDSSGDYDVYSSTLTDPGLVAQFTDICDTIDALVEPFAFMPAPSGFDAYMGDLGKVLRKLGTSEEGGGGTDLNSYIIQMVSVVNDMNGDFIWAFKHYFVNMFEAAAARYYAMGVVLGAALGGEQGLWDKTQQAVDDTVECATKAFEACSLQYESAWDVISGIIGVMAHGLDLFAAALTFDFPPAAAVVEVGAAGLTLVSDFLRPPDDNPQPATTYVSLMEAFRQSIQNIFDDNATQEDLLKASLQSSYETTFSEPWAFATPFAGQPIDQSSNWAEVLIDPEKCSQLCEGTYPVLPKMADILAEVRGTVESMTDSMSWYRDEAFGRGDKGCWANWDLFRWRMRDFLVDLSWKTDMASQVFKDVIRAFEDGDRDAAADLAKLETELNRGSGALTAPDPGYWTDHVHTEGGIGGY
ncbi:MAG: hypothetical protein FWF36_09815 [Propionibacteriaceae bacterium]|nr:hypothetical protein [Propionibacteriaceae bacterium]